MDIKKGDKVVVISGDSMNKYFSLVWILPVSTKVKHFFGALSVTPNEENGLKEVSEILPFHIRTVSKTRLLRKIGELSKKEVRELVKALKSLLYL